MFFVCENDTFLERVVLLPIILFTSIDIIDYSRLSNPDQLSD